MSDHFDWHTDDEDWPDEPIIESELKTVISRRPFWITLLIIVILLIGAGLLVYRSVHNQIEATQREIESELRLTHNLVQQANLEQDAELFRSILSGRDPNWTELQLEQVANGRLFDRQSLGLQAQANIRENQIEISPDLQAAELIFEQSYALQNGKGITEIVQLQQTAVYRRGSQQWLYAPPTEEYWGGWQTWDGRHLAIAYRQRDQDIVEQLAFDFEALLAEVCQLPDMACPADLHLHLRLDSKPESLLVTADTSALLEHSLRLNLPTPSLVGLPTNEAGYQALLQGYSRHLAAAIIVHQVNYTCCQQALLHTAWLDWQLSQLGLVPWLLAAADYDQLFYNNVRVEDFAFAWNDAVDLSRWQRSYILVQFLATESDWSPVAIQRSLQDFESYSTWLVQIMGESFEEKLFDFLISQTTSAQVTEAPLPLPEENLLYVCSGQILQRYDLYNGDFSVLSTSTDSMADYMIVWPLEDGYLVDERYFSDAGTMRSVLAAVDENGRRAFFNSATDYTFNEAVSFVGISPDGRYILLVSFAENNQDSSLTLLDSADCPNNVCRMIPLTGWPIWSPTGHRMLWLDQTELASSAFYAPLMLANNQGQNSTHIAEDAAVPFWLDEQTIGYVRLDGTEQALIIRQLGNPLETVIARTSELRFLLPDGESDQMLRIRYIQTSPADPNLILIMAVGNGQPANPPTYYFLLERKTEGPDISLVHQASFNSFARFSPNGRLLIFTGNNPASSSFSAVTIDILNLDTKQERHLITTDGWFNQDWSADGYWLVRLYDQYLLLMAPAYNYEQIIPGNFKGCGNAIWVNK